MFRLISSSSFLIVTLFILNSVASASPARVCLSITASDQDLFPAPIDAWTGDRTLYVWTRACIVPSGGSKFEFTGNLEVVDLIPSEGVVNEGTIVSPVLRYPECAEDRVVATITVRDATGQGGRLCFGTADDGIVSCGLGCGSDFCEPTVTYGFHTVGADACPFTVSTTKPSWGAAKAIFR